MSNSSGISYIRGSEVKQHFVDDDNSRHIDSVKQIVVRDMSAMLQGMFDGIDDSFFELANNAHSNNEQNRFFEAMRDIRIKRKGIENEFKLSVESRFEAANALSTQSKNSGKLSELESLSLVQNDDLEEEVAISSMATKAAANFQGPLLQFHTRMANLYKAERVEDIIPPLSPRDLSQSFADACKCLETEIKEKLIVLKQFDRYVLSNLGIVLEDANKKLISIGIIPQYKNSFVKQKSTTATTDTIDNQNPAIESSEQNSGTEARASIAPATPGLPQLQRLLANVRNHNPSAGYYSGYTQTLPANAETKFVSTQDLIDLLGAIQSSQPQSQLDYSNNPKVVNIQDELKNKFSDNNNHKAVYPAFKQVDEDVINLVAMLFEFILEDYNLSPAIQVLISRLQIPILKVVIKDNSFFSSSKHPARKLLNQLARSGVSWNESNHKNDKLFDKIESVVNKIVEEFSGDIDLFDELYKDFNDFLTKEEKRSKIVEQRTKESEIGLIKSRLAQNAVEEALECIIASSAVEIPSVITETLNGGWSRVMFLAKLKDEQEHQWLKTCNIAEDLIWCLQPFQSIKDKQHWISIAPKLLKNLKSGLEEVSYNSSGLEQTLLEIRSSLTSAFKHNSLNLDPENPTVTRKQPANNFTQHQSAIEKQKAELDKSLEKYLDQVAELEPGTWIEFTQSAQKTRCKLSAIVEESASYIFVNRMGLKARELSQVELVKMFANKEASVLTQNPIIDRALNALTSSLKQKASA